MKKAAIAALVLVLLAPMLGLLGIGVVMNPAVTNQANWLSPPMWCSDRSGFAGSDDERRVHIHAEQAATHSRRNHHQHRCEHSRCRAGDGILIALMAALTESTLRQLASTALPPNPGTIRTVMGPITTVWACSRWRPQAGWGTVAELMDTTYQARAFYGGPDGPNYPSPRGLLDIRGGSRWTKGKPRKPSKCPHTRTGTRTMSPWRAPSSMPSPFEVEAAAAARLGIRISRRRAVWCFRCRPAPTCAPRRSDRAPTRSPVRRVSTPAPTGLRPMVRRSSLSRTGS